MCVPWPGATLDPLSAITGGAGTMGAIPAGETETMNRGGTTATQNAVNTNTAGQLSAADAGQHHSCEELTLFSCQWWCLESAALSFTHTRLACCVVA